MDTTIQVFSGRRGSAVIPGKEGIYLADWLRSCVWTIMDDFNFAFEMDFNSNGCAAGIEVTDVLAQVGDDLKRICDQTLLLRFREDPKDPLLNVEAFVREAPPVHVLDAVELYVCYLDEENAFRFQDRINTAFEREAVGWIIQEKQFHPLPAVKSAPPSGRDSHEESPEEMLYCRGLVKFNVAQRALKAGEHFRALEVACSSFEDILTALSRGSEGISKSPFGGRIAENPNTAVGRQLLTALSSIHSEMRNQATANHASHNWARVYAELGVSLTSAFAAFGAECICGGRSTTLAQMAQMAKKDGAAA